MISRSACSAGERRGSCGSRVGRLRVGGRSSPCSCSRRAAVADCATACSSSSCSGRCSSQEAGRRASTRGLIVDESSAGTALLFLSLNTYQQGSQGYYVKNGIPTPHCLHEYVLDSRYQRSVSTIRILLDFSEACECIFSIFLLKVITRVQ